MVLEDASLCEDDFAYGSTFVRLSQMAAISPGRPKRSLQKLKKQPTTTNTHRFEPFSRRIARLKIDPVHRVARSDFLVEDVELSKTYFGLSLSQWAELNLSENFTRFVLRVKPVSENLPQILHHADSISETLLQHIRECDLVSSEPLLSLLAHFAHDLGQRLKILRRSIDSGLVPRCHNRCQRGDRMELLMLSLDIEVSLEAAST